MESFELELFELELTEQDLQEVEFLSTILLESKLKLSPRAVKKLPNVETWSEDSPSAKEIAITLASPTNSQPDKLSKHIKIHLIIKYEVYFMYVSNFVIKYCKYFL